MNNATLRLVVQFTFLERANVAQSNVFLIVLAGDYWPCYSDILPH